MARAVRRRGPGRSTRCGLFMSSLLPGVHWLAGEAGRLRRAPGGAERAAGGRPRASRRRPPWMPVGKGEHDDDEDDAVGGDRDVGPGRAGQAVAGWPRRSRRSGTRTSTRLPQTRAGQGAQAAQYRPGEQRDGQGQGEGAGRDDRRGHGEQGARQPGARRADHEGEHPEPGHVQARPARPPPRRPRPPASDRPTRLRARLASRTRTISAAAAGQPGQPAGEREGGAEEAGAADHHGQALVPAEQPGTAGPGRAARRRASAWHRPGRARAAGPRPRRRRRRRPPRRAALATRTTASGQCRCSISSAAA